MSIRKAITRLLAFGVPVAAAAALLVFGLTLREPPKQTPLAERSTAVRVLTIKPTEFRPRAIGYGAVQPARTWNAVAQVAGRVEFLEPRLRSGAVLDAGTEIIRISPQDYTLAVQEAEANLRSAEAKLVELKAEEDNARRAQEIEQRSLGIKQRDLARKKELAERGTVSSLSVEDTERAVLQQQATVLNLENSIRLFPTRIDAQRRQIDVNKTKLETARLNLARTHISLPFDARISAVNIERTQFVGVGTELAKADDIDTAEVEAEIPQDRFHTFMKLTLPKDFTVEKIRSGGISELFKSMGWSATVRLRSNARDVKWPAELLRTSETVDPKTRTVGVIVSVDKPYEGIKPIVRPPLVKGMFVEVEIAGRRTMDRIVIPRSAVHEGRVYIADKGNRLRIRKIDVLAEQGGKAVIESGLSLGERIVISDLSPAIDGMLLKPFADTTEEDAAAISGKRKVAGEVQQ